MPFMVSKRAAWAPFIFKAYIFDHWVVTHSLDDSDFHGHVVIVFKCTHFLNLHEPLLRRFNTIFGWFPSASSAYQKSPTSTVRLLLYFQIKQSRFLTLSKFENKWRPLGPQASNHYLYDIKHLTQCSYPEGNFDKNQLLDASISLSPLFPSFATDLHVRTAIELPSWFLKTSPYSEKDQRLSGPCSIAHDQKIQCNTSFSSVDADSKLALSTVTFIASCGFPPKLLLYCMPPWIVLQDESNNSIFVG